MKRIYFFIHFLNCSLFFQCFLVASDDTHKSSFIVSRFPESSIQRDVFFYLWCGFQNEDLSDSVIREKFRKEWEEQKFEIIDPDCVKLREMKRSVDFITLLLETELRCDQLRQLNGINANRIKRGEVVAYSRVKDFIDFQLSEKGPGTLRFTKEGRKNAIAWAIQHPESKSILMNFSKDQKIWLKSSDALMEEFEASRAKKSDTYLR